MRAIRGPRMNPPECFRAILLLHAFVVYKPQACDLCLSNTQTTDCSFHSKVLHSVRWSQTTLPLFLFLRVNIPRVLDTHGSSRLQACSRGLSCAQHQWQTHDSLRSHPSCVVEVRPLRLRQILFHAL